MVHYTLNLGQARLMCTDDGGCAPLPDQSPLCTRTGYFLNNEVYELPVIGDYIFYVAGPLVTAKLFI